MTGLVLQGLPEGQQHPGCTHRIQLCDSESRVCYPPSHSLLALACVLSPDSHNVGRHRVSLLHSSDVRRQAWRGSSSTFHLQSWALTVGIGALPTAHCHLGQNRYLTLVCPLKSSFVNMTEWETMIEVIANSHHSNVFPCRINTFRSVYSLLLMGRGLYL